MEYKSVKDKQFKNFTAFKKQTKHEKLPYQKLLHFFIQQYSNNTY